MGQVKKAKGSAFVLISLYLFFFSEDLPDWSAVGFLVAQAKESEND